ncbi:MAG TPA: glycosyl hydrolase [Solirubrobacterales bacterium]|jgi:hypothetical protein
MRRGRHLGLALLAAVFLAAPAAASADMYWGGLIKGESFNLSGEAPTSAAVLNRFESDAGKEITMVNTGQSWVSFDRGTMDAAIAAGAVPLVTMPLPENISLAEVAAGDQDQQIREWAKAAKEFGYPFLFRPWWEMNGAWYPWGQKAGFVAAWRHFHQVVVEAGATNVTWAWIINTIYEQNGTVADDPHEYWPGAQYVDWVGMDAYNWGRNPLQPDRWLDAEESIEPTLEVLEGIAPGKPVCICESASTEIGEGAANESKALWIHEMLGEYLPSQPSIKAYLWFDWNVEQGGYGSGLGKWDWPIESSPAAQQAFHEGIQSSTYLSALPAMTPLHKLPIPGVLEPPSSAGSEPAPASGAEGTEPASVRNLQALSSAQPREPMARGTRIVLGDPRPSGRPGGAILPITVAGPGQLRISGGGLRARILPSRHLVASRLSKSIAGAGELRLEVRAAGRKQRQLVAEGSAKLVVSVGFEPAGGGRPVRKRLGVALSR